MNIQNKFNNIHYFQRFKQSYIKQWFLLTTMYITHTYINRNNGGDNMSDISRTIFHKNTWFRK